MGVAYSGRQQLRSATLALVGAALGTSAYAQAPADQPVPPPPVDTTTVVEVPTDVPQQSESPPPHPAQPEPASPEHVPPDASGFQLSTLETKNLSLLYIDPIQTYLTPYLGRSFENALAFHRKMFNWHAARDERFLSPLVQGMARTSVSAFAIGLAPSVGWSRP